MRYSPALAAAAFLAACATSLPPPNAPAAPATVEVKTFGVKGQAAAERSMKMVATIAIVDLAARTLTIKGADGNNETVKVPPEVKGFEALAAGDAVEVDFRQGLLLEYQPEGTPPVVKREVAWAGWPGLNIPSEGSSGTATQASTNVAAIDLKARLLTFQGPARNQYQVKVGPQIALEKLKVGDQLLVTYVQAVAVQVVKVEEKKP